MCCQIVASSAAESQLLIKPSTGEETQWLFVLKSQNTIIIQTASEEQSCTKRTVVSYTNDPRTIKYVIVSCCDVVLSLSNATVFANRMYAF